MIAIFLQRVRILSSGSNEGAGVMDLGEGHQHHPLPRWTTLSR